MRLGDLITEAQRRAGRVDSNFDVRTTQWLNSAQEVFVTADPHSTLQHEETFAADGTSDLYLPSYVKKIISIMDETNKLPIERHENWDREAPGTFIEETAGGPQWWRELGLSPVSFQPTEAAQVFCDPLSGENVVCSVVGLAQDTARSGTAIGKFLAQEQVTCQSGAEGSTTSLFVKILTLGKDVLTTDDVTFAFSTGGTVISRAFRNDHRAAYRHVQLLRVPGAGTLLRVKFLINLPDMTDVNQIVHPGVDSEFLTWWAAGMIHKATNEEDRAGIAFGMARERLQKRVHYEDAFGDQDHRLAPDPLYWSFEDDQQWPQNR